MRIGSRLFRRAIGYIEHCVNLKRMRIGHGSEHDRWSGTLTAAIAKNEFAPLGGKRSRTLLGDAAPVGHGGVGREYMGAVTVKERSERASVPRKLRPSSEEK